jgi:hypothetical protein
MNNNGRERITSREQLANGPPANHDEAHLIEPSVTENQNGLYGEVERLRLAHDDLWRYVASEARLSRESGSFETGWRSRVNSNCRYRLYNKLFRMT